MFSLTKITLQKINAHLFIARQFTPPPPPTKKSFIYYIFPGWGGGGRELKLVPVKSAITSNGHENSAIEWSAMGLIE